MAIGLLLLQICFGSHPHRLSFGLSGSKFSLTIAFALPFPLLLLLSLQHWVRM
jgi:hypothetical protein